LFLVKSFQKKALPYYPVVFKSILPICPNLSGFGKGERGRKENHAEKGNQKNLLLKTFNHESTIYILYSVSN